MTIVPMCIGTALLISIPLFAQTPPISRAEYDQQMASLQKKEFQLREDIAQEQASILQLKKKIEASRERITALRQKKLALVGINENGLVQLQEEMHGLEEGLNRLLEAADDEFINDAGRFQMFLEQFETLKQKPATRLRSIKPGIEKISLKISQAETRYISLAEQNAAAKEQENAVIEPVSSSGAPESYTVSNRAGTPETLYGIASKMYGDPYQWIRIYNANKSTIDSNFNRLRKKSELKSIAEPSDLIFPGQVLVIPR